MSRKTSKQKGKSPNKCLPKNQPSILDLFKRKRDDEVSILNSTKTVKDFMGIGSNPYRSSNMPTISNGKNDEGDDDDDDEEVQILSVAPSRKSKYFSGSATTSALHSNSKLRLKKSVSSRKNTDNQVSDASLRSESGTSDLPSTSVKRKICSYESPGHPKTNEPYSKKSRTSVFAVNENGPSCSIDVNDSCKGKRSISNTSEDQLASFHGTNQPHELEENEGLKTIAGNATSSDLNEDMVDATCMNESDKSHSGISSVMDESSASIVSHRAAPDNSQFDGSIDGKSEFLVESDDTPKYQPYYIENFKLVIETVLGDEFYSYLFDEEDLIWTDSFFKSLTEAAKKLYVRLFLRKHKWLCPRKIKYPKIASELTPFLKELVDVGLLEDEVNLEGLELCLNLLPAENLRTFAKKMHVDVTNQRMSVIIEALLKQSKKKTVGAMFGMKCDLESSMSKRVKALVGPCYRVKDAPRLVFLRCMMLFSLTSTAFEDEEQVNSQQLFQILQVNRGDVTYPAYKIERETRIFRMKKDLIGFQTAVNLYSDILGAIENHAFETGLDVYKQAKALYVEHCADETLIGFESTLPCFLRVYTAGSVYVRVLNQGVEVLQKMKNYVDANVELKDLLSQSVHCQHYRGHWWDRLALNLDQHLKKPAESLDAVRQGLSDSCVRAGRRLALFHRAQKICESPSNKKLKKRLKEFKHASVREAPKVTIQGRLLPKSLRGIHAGGHFISTSCDGDSQDVTLCRVEQVALEHYRQEGYDQGIHGEGSTFSVLLRLFFWDIIFMEGIADVFYHKHQMAPLDIRSEDFYLNRKRPINKQLKWLKSATEKELLEELEKTWLEHDGEVCAGMNWERFENVEQAKGLVKAMKGEFLSAVFKRILKDPRHTSSGMPDLVVWNTTDDIYRLVEVKGPGDKLSTKQILWLDYFLSLGATAEVCHVVGVGAKRLHSIRGSLDRADSQGT